MRPLLGIVIEPGEASIEQVAELCAEACELFNTNGPVVRLSVIQTEAELAQFQAGHLVLYRKPVRKRTGTDLSYRKADGSVVKADQTTLFDE